MLTEQKTQHLNAEQMSMFLFKDTLITVQAGYTGDGRLLSLFSLSIFLSSSFIIIIIIIIL